MTTTVERDVAAEAEDGSAALHEAAEMPSASDMTDDECVAESRCSCAMEHCDGRMITEWPR